MIEWHYAYLISFYVQMAKPEDICDQSAVLQYVKDFESSVGFSSKGCIASLRRTPKQERTIDHCRVDFFDNPCEDPQRDRHYRPLGDRTKLNDVVPNWLRQSTLSVGDQDLPTLISTKAPYDLSISDDYQYPPEAPSSVSGSMCSISSVSSLEHPLDHFDYKLENASNGTPGKSRTLTIQLSFSEFQLFF